MNDRPFNVTRHVTSPHYGQQGDEGEEEAVDGQASPPSTFASCPHYYYCSFSSCWWTHTT